VLFKLQDASVNNIFLTRDDTISVFDLMKYDSLRASPPPLFLNGSESQADAKRRPPVTAALRRLKLAPGLLFSASRGTGVIVEADGRLARVLVAIGIADSFTDSMPSPKSTSIVAAAGSKKSPLPIFTR